MNFSQDQTTGENSYVETNRTGHNLLNDPPAQ